MPWQERTPMERRRQFIEDWLTELWTMSELCAAYDVSRKTGYQLLKRFGAEGWAAVVERSRRPHRTPPPIPAEVVARVLMLRERHPRWGARKLRGRLLRREPTVAWPSQTAIHRLLHQAALVGEAPKRRALPSVRSGRLRRADAPNDVWTVDFQGDFRLGSGQRCYPLTLRDLASRYVLRCDALAAPEAAETRRRFERAFATFGLPACIRSDNGEPFAGPGLVGLSQLNIWWLRLGIAIEHITPGRPQQNGAHEQFHRVLRAETTRPPAATHQRQQVCYERFGREYNEERPHAALNDAVPADYYQPSPRRYPSRVPPVEYPGHWEPRRVGANGRISFGGASIFLSRALAQEWVALEEIDDGLWTIFFTTVPLARWVAREHRLRPVS